MNQKQKKRKKRYYVRLGFLFAFCIAVFPVINLIGKDRAYSETENRSLAQKPELSVGRIADGSFMKDYESYCADQFAVREWFVRLKAGTDLISGKREENGVYKGKDKYLLEEIKKGDQRSIEENVKAMKAFRSAYSEIPFRVLIAPNAASVLKDKLPSFATLVNQREQLEKLKKELGSDFTWIDAGKTLRKHKTEDIYYRTDHHWTTEGAYEVFKANAAELGIPKESLVPMKLYPVTEEFNGTLSAMSGLESGCQEKISIAVPKKKEQEVEYLVSYPEEQRTEASIYDSGQLKKKDKYAVFFGGNYPRADIRTTQSETSRLLVIKDSYANCFVQFLLPYYREIVMVDPRYYSGSIQKLMQERGITDVLFLYNMNTFVEDNNISGVLEEYGEDRGSETE